MLGGGGQEGSGGPVRGRAEPDNNNSGTLDGFRRRADTVSWTATRILGWLMASDGEPDMCGL